MKNAVVFLAFITITAPTNPSFSQLKIAGPAGIGDDIRKVISDYPNHFSNLRGELIVQNPQSVDYHSNFVIKGAEESFISEYSANNKTIASWQSIMITSESFSAAAKKFRSLFNQLNNLSVQLGGKSFHLKAKWEEPVEERSFTSIAFSLHDADESEKLKVDLSLQYQMPEWKVRILVYNKEREDFERGQSRD